MGGLAVRTAALVEPQNPKVQAADPAITAEVVTVWATAFRQSQEETGQRVVRTPASPGRLARMAHALVAQMCLPTSPVASAITHANRAFAMVLARVLLERP